MKSKQRKKKIRKEKNKEKKTPFADAVKEAGYEDKYYAKQR